MIEHQNLRRFLKRDLKSELKLAKLSQTKFQSISEWNPVIRQESTGFWQLYSNQMRKMEEKIRLLESRLPRKWKKIEAPLKSWQNNLLKLFIKGKMQLVTPVIPGVYTFYFYLR